jgi:aryl-alcohol dehydrogenase-like predicted oxidoreductase
MEYRPLGRTGVKVSALCLGAWMFGDRVAEKQAKAIVAASLDAGINFIDTANYYGKPKGLSEEIVGRAIRESGRRDRLIIATKVFQVVDPDDPNGGGLSRRHVIAECEKSLKRLGTDCIDLYYLHRFEPKVPIDEPLRALDDLVRAGKVRYIGASNTPAWAFVESLWVAKELGLNRLVAETPPYNLLDRRVERELIPMCQTFGVAVCPWGPLGQELLTGRYRRNQPPDPSSRGADPYHGRLMKLRTTDSVFDVLDLLEPMARERGCSVPELALGWVCSQPGITSPVIGCELLAEVASSVKALGIRLSDDEQKRIDALVPPGEGVAPFYTSDPSRFQPHPFRV